jgi:hypothetical protein
VSVRFLGDVSGCLDCGLPDQVTLCLADIFLHFLFISCYTTFLTLPLRPSSFFFFFYGYISCFFLIFRIAIRGPNGSSGSHLIRRRHGYASFIVHRLRYGLRYQFGWEDDDSMAFLHGWDGVMCT